MPHPHIFSESGRSLTAHHAMLVVQVTDVEKHNDEIPRIETITNLPETVRYLVELLGRPISRWSPRPTGAPPTI